ncbi:MAG: sulfite exporter TauE/SafE family protein [Burkholderiales bacterium]
MSELGLLSVFFAGLLGGVHCAGMCGGIVSALSLQPGGTIRRNGVNVASGFSLHLAYNSGRIASYAFAGALAGMAGSGSIALAGSFPARQVLYVAANVMLLVLGLYLAGAWRGLLQLERVGTVVWKQVQPLTKNFLPVNNAPRAFMLGTLWGWIPCGLVYSMLIVALASGSMQNGALVMLAFGLGTLPNLLAVGVMAARMRALIRYPAVRIGAGIMVAGFGVIGLIRAEQMSVISLIAQMCKNLLFPGP